jgi:hypothetical protein
MRAALEQPQSEPLFQLPHLVADRRRGERQLVRRTLEARVARGRFERA